MAPPNYRFLLLVAGLVPSLSAGCQLAISPQDGGPGAAPIHPPAAGLRRLSSREYNNLVRDLLGDVSRPADRFVGDVFVNGYDNGSVGLAVQSDQVADYQTAAEALADRVVSRPALLARVLGECNAAERGQETCSAAFLDGFAARAWRRPLTDTERQRMADVIASGSAPESADSTDGGSRTGGGFHEGIRMALEVLFQSPAFLYREELGAGEPGPASDTGDVTVRLTDEEVASELSFLLTGSLPDDELWEAARQGRFATPADRRREARRLLGTPAARDTLRAFLHQWLATDRLATLSKDPTVYPEWNRALARSMARDLDGVYNEALWSGAGSLRELLTTDRGYVDAALAPIYGGPTAGVTLAPVRLDASQRGGVLTRAGFLAVHASAADSGPIGRGVFVLDRILCRAPSPPPGSIPPVPAPGDGAALDLTTRQRFEAHTSTPFCRGCHRAIDGVGFTFENYDGIGRYRSSEGGRPVDAGGALMDTGEPDSVDGPVTGAVELSARLSRSQRVARCFAGQTWRYAMGRIESDAEDLSWLGQSTSTDERITDLLLRIVEHPTFVYRTVEAAGRNP